MEESVLVAAVEPSPPVGKMAVVAGVVVCGTNRGREEAAAPRDGWVRAGRRGDWPMAIVEEVAEVREGPAECWPPNIESWRGPPGLSLLFSDDICSELPSVSTPLLPSNPPSPSISPPSPNFSPPLPSFSPPPVPNDTAVGSVGFSPLILAVPPDLEVPQATHLESAFLLLTMHVSHDQEPSGGAN